MFFAFFAGTANIVYFFKNGNRAKKFYVLAKGLVIIYLGAMYGVVAVDYWVDIVNYPGPGGELIMQMLRIAAVSTALTFLFDVWMRDKL